MYLIYESYRYIADRNIYIIYSNYVAYQYAYYSMTLLLLYIINNKKCTLLFIMTCLYILVTLLIASSVRPQAMTKLIYHYRNDAGRLQILTCATRQTSKQISLLDTISFTNEGRR